MQHAWKHVERPGGIQKQTTLRKQNQSSKKKQQQTKQKQPKPKTHKRTKTKNNSEVKKAHQHNYGTMALHHARIGMARKKTNKEHNVDRHTGDVRKATDVRKCNTALCGNQDIINSHMSRAILRPAMTPHVVTEKMKRSVKTGHGDRVECAQHMSRKDPKTETNSTLHLQKAWRGAWRGGFKGASSPSQGGASFDPC